MTFLAATVGWTAALLVCYVYIGYPTLLWVITRFRHRPVYQENITPSVTLIISAYNEAGVIRAKLQNTLSLDYPPEQFEFIVVSDASSDGTDAIVESFAGRGVKLVRMCERQGKTAGLNTALQHARGEIVVFSDANILYRKDAIGRLVRNFADASVGCVTGNSCYSNDSQSSAHLQENTYWQYEQTLRRLESQLGSAVGGDGAIFAIRKSLYRTLPPDSINDLVIPLQIVARGYRAVFEPSAVGFEPSVGNFSGEFRRKRRIVNRSWRGVRSVPRVLDPRLIGIFAWQVWSHKVLRWFVFPMILTTAVGCFVAFPAGLIYRIGAFGFTASIVIAAFGGLAKASLGLLGRLAQGLFYFYMVNIAAFLGIIMAISGRVEVLWTPERKWSAPSR